MRILMLGCKEYPYGISSRYEKYSGGGIGKYVIALAKGLTEKGHIVHLIVRRFPGQKIFEKHDGIHIHRVRYIPGKLFILPSSSFFSFFKALSLQKQFDIIHTHNPFSAFFGLWLKRLTKKPVVGTLHGIGSTQVKGFGKKAVRLVSYLEKTTYPKFDKVIFLSKTDQEKYARIYGKHLTNAQLICSGIEHSEHKSIRRDPALFKVLFVGRLEKVKAADKLIESYSQLSKELQEKIRYVIVGDGSQREALKALIIQNHLEDKVSLVGFQLNTKQYYQDADLFVLPSYSEGFPVSVLEAMTAKVPCLINNLKIPVSEESLFIMEDNEPKTIADNITQIYADKKARKQKTEKAFREVQKKFSFESFVKKQAKTYKELL
jgi:glycosyltransferase involved in cell wall biosynthesis